MTASSSVGAFQVAESGYLLSIVGALPYLYEKTFKEAMHNPIVIVYASSIIGMPKSML